ncbi:MAG: molybdopterin molybdotransferase MoeA [Rhizobiales bacterium]|nr:molybdopterin molybdotransferase MoeA [Hyphomicrobiales bacterium]
MAQLSDDCFAFNGPLLPIEKAERMMTEQVDVVSECENVRLADAMGRVLAADLLAPISLPAFDNSAVDGYAVRHADIATSGETRLSIVGRVTAGAEYAAGLRAGEALRIFTGAPMPQGADTIYMQEDCSCDDTSVYVPAGLKRGANRRLAGEDIAAGDLAITAGQRLTPAHIALAAAIGLDHLGVRRRVRVALFSTGDEIVEPGQPLSPAALYDSNRYLLRSLLERMGIEVNDLGILKDDPSALADALDKAAANHDLILTTGGVSTGEADHVRTAVERLGRLVFWRLAIKPGRPVAMGVIRGAAFTGLPGNPVAVFVTFIHVVRPLVLRLAGAKIEPLARFPARATFHYKKKSGRREYLRVTARFVNGIAEVDNYPVEGAGVLTSITRTTGLVELLDDVTQIEPGTNVDYLPYSSLFG